MSRVDLGDFMGSKPDKPMGMKIEVDVRCQICHEDVDEAEYFSSARLLKWVCPEGHVSFIEEFRL